MVYGEAERVREMKFKSNARYNEPVEGGTIFEGKIGNTRISVHKIIHCDGWFLSCPDLRISQMQLKSDTLMSAIEESKEVLKKVVEDLRKDIDCFCKSEIEISRY